jgi:SAM-dependent methyltransferase
MALMTGPGYHASDGAAYEVFLGRWSRRLAEATIDVAAFPAEGDLLDIGCGTGSLALALEARWPGRRVVGIDPAEPYIDFARARRAGTLPIFDVGDAGALPYENDAFAGAVAQLSLNFVGDPEIALGEARRVVRRGGAIVASVWDFRGGVVWQRLFWDSAAGIDPKAGAERDRLFSAALALPDGLVDLFRRAGLAEIVRHSLTIRMDYAAFDDYWSPLLGGQGPVGTYVTQLAPELQPRIREAVRAAYLSGAPDGPRSMTATAWVVRGVVPPK